MGDITVTHFTKSIILPDMANTLHSHDQWHFCLICRGNAKRPDGSLRLAPACYCAPPGTIHGRYNLEGFVCVRNITPESNGCG